MAFKENNPSGDSGQSAADLHRQWLSCYWTHYTKEAHLGLAYMYTQDQRFKAYYDKYQEGLADFLKEVIEVYVK